MCGRFVQISDPEKIRVSLPEIEVDEEVKQKYKEHYNIAPTQDILTVLNTPTPRLTFTNWGLVPHWAKDIGNRMINARAETLLTKPSFKDSFRKRRCIIFADGFYEWQKVGKTRVPYFIRMKDKEPFAIAGLWDTWIDKKTGNTLLSSTIITTDANSAVTELHDRMPVILSADHYETWITNRSVWDETLMSFLRPYPSDRMEPYRISQLVNDPRNDTPELIKHFVEQ